MRAQSTNEVPCSRSLDARLWRQRSTLVQSRNPRYYGLGFEIEEARCEGEDLTHMRTQLQPLAGSVFHCG
jgi:hypothetical protein